MAPLKLMAKDHDDLSVVSAYLQDALMPLTAMTYDKNTQTFSILANRFCWEHDPIDHEGRLVYHRVHSGVCFRNVIAVHHKGFVRHQEHTRELNFLSVLPESPWESIPTSLNLIFSSANEIRLKISNLTCHMADLQHPWPTYGRPMHIYDHVAQHLQNNR